jgi:O-antigen/teichoic acid export membrane protein
MRRAGERFREWSTILRDYLLWQPLIQLVGILAGLLLVNLMTTREYAFYTLASAAMTLLALLCDLGITNSLLYFRREAATRNVSFDAYLQAATWLRRGLLAVGAPVFVIVFSILAFRSGFGAAETYASAVVVMAGVWFQMTAAISLLSLRLSGRYREAYGAELAGALARLGTATAMALGSAMYAVLAISGNALGSAVTARAGRRGTRPGGGPPSAAVRATRIEIVRYVMPLLPSALYFSFQGTLMAFLTAIFGQTRNIAEVGALGRLGLIIGLLAGLIPAVIIPRLAGVVSDRLYRRRYVQFGLLLALCGAALALGAREWPGLFLALLGRQYAGLEPELMLTVGAASVGLLGAYCAAINQTRAWVRWEPAALGIFAATQIVLIGALPLSTTAGVLRFSLLSGAVGGLLQLVINIAGFWHPAWVSLKRSPV